MKPFNLEEAIAGKPICTRNGRKARILCYDRDNQQLRCIVALVTEPNGLEEIYTYTLKGQISRHEESNHDLVMASERKTGWINIYKGTIRLVPGGYLYDTEEEAKGAAEGAVNYFTTVKVCWEE